ncbi:MAG TPA: hypothetical protein VML55_12465 [Planctomycetaceae bacterium]|nr:hypothetical protein [Planctomycetaceae bacterium]
MQYRACEEMIEAGLDAYRWLRRAEGTLREADDRGLFNFTSEVVDDRN